MNSDEKIDLTPGIMALTELVLNLAQDVKINDCKIEGLNGLVQNLHQHNMLKHESHLQLGMNIIKNADKLQDLEILIGRHKEELQTLIENIDRSTSERIILIYKILASLKKDEVFAALKKDIDKLKEVTDYDEELMFLTLQPT